MEKHHVEKPLWTDNDFNEMNWHDVHIHAISFRPDTYELLFDLDYILEWVKSPSGDAFSFWLAPATLIFENASYINIDIETGVGDVSIYQLTRKDGVKTPKGGYTN